MNETYNLNGVALSVLIAMFASYVALNLAGRVSQAVAAQRKYWLLGGAFSMGIGIWSMHFTGMLAFSLPVRIGYDVPITAASALIAMLVSGFALFMVSRERLGARNLLLAGLLMGLGICAMHYTGMAAMRMSPPIRYEPLLFGASVLIAIGAAIAALWIAFRLRGEESLAGSMRRIGAAVVMGLAISGMHYTGMAAAQFAPDSVCLAANSFDAALLESTITSATFAILGITLVLSIFDARLAGRTATYVASLGKANQELTATVGELERVNRDMSELSRMGRFLQACQSSDEACAAIAQSGRILFSDANAALYLMRSSRDRLEHRAGWGDAASPEPLIALDSCWALRRGQTYRVDDPDRNLLCTHVRAPDHPAPPYLCVPLIAQTELVGLLHLQFPAEAGSPARAIAESQIQLAATFADQAGLALANLKLKESLREQSIRDPLTGLYNRRYLEETLGRELARAKRDRQPLALFMLDADHFKRCNDNFGHDAGDAVLRALGGLLRESCRAGDVACRYGGEEFTVLLSDVTQAQATDWAERFMLGVRAMEVKSGSVVLPCVTVSIGLAMYPEQGADAETLLRLADAALYEAKQTGRNRLVQAGGISWKDTLTSVQSLQPQPARRSLAI